MRQLPGDNDRREYQIDLIHIHGYDPCRTPRPPEEYRNDPDNGKVEHDNGKRNDIQIDRISFQEHLKHDRSEASQQQTHGDDHISGQTLDTVVFVQQHNHKGHGANDTHNDQGIQERIPQLLSIGIGLGIGLDDVVAIGQGLFRGGVRFGSGNVNHRPRR